MSASVLNCDGCIKHGKAAYRFAVSILATSMRRWEDSIKMDLKNKEGSQQTGLISLRTGSSEG
jgi:hypothetical protein